MIELVALIVACLLTGGCATAAMLSILLDPRPVRHAARAERLLDGERFGGES